MTDERVPPEDIEKMARVVLAIQLPRSPDQIRSMINDINNLLFNANNFQDNLKNLEKHANTAQDLLQKAKEVKSVPENKKQWKVLYFVYCNPCSTSTDGALY